LEDEAIGLLESLKMVISKDLRHVAFEIDNKLLVDLLGNTNLPLNEIGDLVSKCKTLLLSNTTKKAKISKGYLVRENVKSLSNSVTKFCD